jgi:hypothetical protein
VTRTIPNLTFVQRQNDNSVWVVTYGNRMPAPDDWYQCTSPLTNERCWATGKDLDEALPVALSDTAFWRALLSSEVLYARNKVERTICWITYPDSDKPEKCKQPVGRRWYEPWREDNLGRSRYVFLVVPKPKTLVEVPDASR